MNSNNPTVIRGRGITLPDRFSINGNEYQIIDNCKGRHDFGVGGISPGRNGANYENSIYKHITIYINGIRKHLWQHGDGNGLAFSSYEDAKVYNLEHGYSGYYSRNTCEFISSRAFRKHTGKTYVDNPRYPHSVKCKWDNGNHRAEQNRNRATV